MKEVSRRAHYPQFPFESAGRNQSLSLYEAMATHLTAFITSADLTTFLGAEKEKLTANGMTAAKFARVIAEINSEIDGYVQYRELEFTPDALKNHACVIARYRLHQDKASERMKDEYDDSLAFFAKVASGAWALPYAVPAQDSTASAGVWFTAKPARFTGRAF